MCFSIPCKVVKIENGDVFVEGGQRIKTGSELRVKKGDYLQISGNVAVGKLSNTQGLKIRKLIKSLNSYDG